MGGWPEEKDIDRKSVFPHTMLENQYSLLTQFISLEWWKEKNNHLLKNFWPDSSEVHEEEEVKKVCGKPLGMGLGCYPKCDKMK